MSFENQSNEIIAKEIVIAVIQRIELDKQINLDQIPEYVSDMYKTIYNTVCETVK